MKRGKALAAALAFVLGTGALAASAEAACVGRCKAHGKSHKMRRRVYGEGHVLGSTLSPPPPLRTLDLPTPTLPERRYQPGVAPPSPFLPNDLPSTFLPQKL